MRRRRSTDGGNSVGGVVIGGDYQGLGIVRSLGRHGIPTCVLDDELSVARFSRYATHSVRVRTIRSEEALLEALVELRRRFGLEGWVVYPTRDETVAALARHRDTLSEHFRIATPPWETVRYAWDKRNTYALCESLGVPAPRTWYPRTVDDLETLRDNLPLALKPAIKEQFFYATKAKAWRADTYDELVDVFKRASEVAPGEAMLQELIPGDGEQQLAYCALFDGDRELASMVVKRRRQHPPDFGRASTYVVTDQAIPEIEEPSRRFLAAIEYRGLAELEFKRDPRDGVCKLLDFNARTWGYHSLGARAGVDFPYLLYLYALGRSVEPSRGSGGISWVRLATDLPTAIVELWRRRLDVGSYWQTIRRADVESVFSRDDLLPGVVEMALVPYLAVKRGY